MNTAQRRRPRAPLWIAAAAFLLVLIAQFPARWCRALLPANIRCQQLSGTLWHGQCDALTIGANSQGEANWQLHPLALLRGQLNADLDLTQVGVLLSGNFSLSLGSDKTGHRIEARNLQLRGLQLEQLPLPRVAPNLRGQIQAEIELARWADGRIQTLVGQIQVSNLTVSHDAIGSYRLDFPTVADTTPVGALRDTDGPLHVLGSLKLTSEPGFELSGRVAARSNAPSVMADQITYLGSADAEGMRPFSIAGSF